MLLIFQVCFYVGAGFAVISLILGNIFNLMGFDGIEIDLDVDSINGSIFPVSPLVIILFITVFGGSGMILSNTFGTLNIMIFILSAIIGIVISFTLNRLIFIPLKRAQNTSTPEADELIGVLAKVIEGISCDSFGEITYVINGNSYNAPAKSIDETAIEKGAEVSICWIKENVFYVTSITVDRV